jgi:CHASE2 domain-containing sensor protein
MMLRRVTQWFIVTLTMFLWGVAGGFLTYGTERTEALFFIAVAVASTVATAIIFRS